MRLATQPLHPLAFGDHHAKRFDSSAAAQDEAVRLMPGLRTFDFFDRRGSQVKTSLAVVNGLPLAAAAMSPSQIFFSDRPDPVFVFPFAGRSDAFFERSVLTLQAKQSAIFFLGGSVMR